LGLKITILTVGSRGDIEPYTALALGLLQAGHSVRVAAPANLGPFVTARGLLCVPMRWDSFSVFRSEAGPRVLSGGSVRGAWELPEWERTQWQQVMEDAWQAARGSEALIVNPLVIGASDAAEKLGIPVILAYYAPQFTPTGAFPNPLLAHMRLGRIANRLSHAIVQRLFLKKLTGLRNRWRVRSLGLPARPWYASDYHRNGQPLPILYAFSRHVVPQPADWRGPVAVTGYWFLETAADWSPPDDLLAFLAAGPPPVYVGFGSMASANPAGVTEAVVAALKRSGQRGVLATGWGGLAPARLPETLFQLDAVPHHWLFPRVSAVVHHGGAGTTATGLRAGKPTVVCPYAFDQPFWGRVVHELGVGPRPVPQRELSAERLGAAVRDAATDTDIRRRAEDLGNKIRAEDGVARAVDFIHQFLSAPRRAGVCATNGMCQRVPECGAPRG
jgi:sterol 3beta-glucosyltransferase